MPRTARNRITKPIEATEMEMGQDETVKLPSTGSVPPKPSIIQKQSDGPEFRKKAEALSFMEEKVVLMVHEASDPNAEKRVFLSVNGRSVWLERGINYIVARKYVEVLARAKPQGIQTISAKDADGNHTTHIRKTRSLAYPFSVLQDKNPNGAAWLRDLMAQP